MKERPIIFSTPMVQAILDGRKTQTRRIIKPQPELKVMGGQPLKAMQAVLGKDEPIGWAYKGCRYMPWPKFLEDHLCPYGHVSDKLWVRETWFSTRFDYKELLAMGITSHLRYKADNNYDPKKDCVGRSWKPSIHMPRKAARIFLPITNIRVERVQDITEEDAKAEGVIKRFDANKLKEFPNGIWKNYLLEKSKYGGLECDSAKDSFRSLWKLINGSESWDANPWIWVIEFINATKI